MWIGLLFTLGAVVSMVLSETAKKKFNKDCPFFFAFICSLFALIFFIFSSGFKFEFNKGILVYSALFGLAYAIAIVFTIFAYKHGNFFTSGLVITYSLLLPTTYGILILKNETSIFFFIGLALLCIAIFLIFLRKKDPSVEKPKFNFLWLVLIVIAFIGNGFCNIFQTAEQIAFDGMYKNELMIVGLAIATIVFLIFALIFDLKKIKDGFKPALLFGSISGLLNGALNLLIMYAVNILTATIAFPLTYGGSLILTFVIARFIFKEKYTLLQYIGFGVCLVSVVLLNL